MVKLSEALKAYKSREYLDEVDRYYAETQIEKKKHDLEMLIEILGDVDFEEESLKAFLYEVGTLEISRFGISLVDVTKQIKTIYGLIKGSKLPSRLICTLFHYYKLGAYELFEAEIRSFIISHYSIKEEELAFKLKEIISKATIIASKDALKLDAFKDEYGKEFITRVQEIAKSRFIPFARVVSILPSKEFIDSSSSLVPLGYTISSGEDLVIRRLLDYVSEEDFEKTEMDKCIKLGYCSSGESIYTSFTKEEYLKSLKDQKHVFTKKKEGI